MTQQVQSGKVKSVEIRVTTTGGAGVSTGNATSNRIVGEILDVEVLWHASAPAGTSDIVVEGATTGVDIYAKSNAVTPVKKTPGLFGVDSGNTALTSDVTPQKRLIAEPIKVTVSQCDDLTDAAIVRVTYRSVRCEVVKVTTTGSAGSAAGNASSNPFTGELLGILLDYGAAPNTSDLTVTGAVSGFQYFANTNTNTDGFVVPAVFSVDLAGSALSSDVTPRRYCVGEALKFTLAQCDALAPALTAYVFYEPCEAETIYVTTTGVDGSAAGSGTSLRNQGELLGMLINYHASAPATTDITVKTAAPSANHTPPNIYAKADSVTDAYVVPGRFAVSNADASLASNVTPERAFFASPITVALAQCNALTNAAAVTIFTRTGS